MELGKITVLFVAIGWLITAVIVMVTTGEWRVGVYCTVAGMLSGLLIMGLAVIKTGKREDGEEVLAPEGMVGVIKAMLIAISRVDEPVSYTLRRDMWEAISERERAAIIKMASELGLRVDILDRLVIFSNWFHPDKVVEV